MHCKYNALGHIYRTSNRRQSSGNATPHHIEIKGFDLLIGEASVFLLCELETQQWCMVNQDQKLKKGHVQREFSAAYR